MLAKPGYGGGVASKRLLIVDGYSLLYRAFYGTKFLSTSDGRPTNALFGLVNMLFALIERQRPVAILVALDAPGKTFRHAEFAEYKGTRREMPDEMRVQMPIARELLTALGIPQLELVGYEADDIVGTISLQAEQAGYETTIITGDLDALQLVDACVSVVTPKVGVTETSTYDVAAVIARYGFGPELIPDYKALVGDTSDNIPGVPGVGEKTASKLILEHGTVEMILDNLPQIEEKFRKKIEPAIEQIPKSKWLATIDRKAPVSFDFAPFKLSSEAAAAGKAMLETLEFKSHIRRFDTVFAPYRDGFEAGPESVAVSVVSEQIEHTEGPRLNGVADAEKWIGDEQFSAIGTPATGQTSMFDEPETQEYVLAKNNETRRISADQAIAFIGKHLGQAVLHDSKPLLRKCGWETDPGFDTMIAAYVLQAGRTNYVAKDLIHGYLDVMPPASIESEAVGLLRLRDELSDRLVKESQWNIYNDIERPLIPILASVERTGVRVSGDVLREFSKELQTAIEKTTREVYDYAGCEFLIGSPKQLGEVLFEKLGLPGARRTKTGFATGAEVLQLYAAEYPIAERVLAWRELTKLKSTYADALPRMIGEDGRIHTTFNQTVAATGRLSSADPNLQNIPIRTELGRHIRKAFLASEGRKLISYDYSQIELRLLAHLCADDNLVDAFQERVDVHTVTASLMFRIERDEVTKEQRRLAKMLNYAVLYGVTDFGLANQLGAGFSVAESRDLIKQYFERFPKVKAFTDSVIEEARQKGFTTTILGRRRYFPEIHASNRNERLYAERQAVNAPIQGAAADMIKVAMIDVWKSLRGKSTQMVLQVHDELLFELDPSEASDLVEPLRSHLENSMPLTVPVEVDAKVGDNWDTMSPVER